MPASQYKGPKTCIFRKIAMHAPYIGNLFYDNEVDLQANVKLHLKDMFYLQKSVIFVLGSITPGSFQLLLGDDADLGQS